MAGVKRNRQQQDGNDVQQTRQHPEATKAQAVADLLAGESVHATARRYGTSEATIRRWREQAGLAAPPAAPQNPLGEPDFRALTLHYLEESLAAGERILKQTENPAWLAEQRAGELAVFLGVVFDKAARILGALADGQPGPGSDQVDTGAPGLPAPG